MKLRSSLLFLLIAIAAHVYLTQHYYDLAFGLGTGDNICNINATFSCDTVTASRFATFLGVPVAAWGAAANVMLLVLVFGWLVGWADDVKQLGRYSIYLSGLIALTSIVMGSISMFYIGSFCIFCMTAYVCSFVVFGLLWTSREKEPFPIKKDFLNLFTEAKTYLGFLIAIPVMAFLFNQAILSSMGGSNVNEMVRDSVASWNVAPVLAFGVQPSMIKGASDDNAKMVVTEFADFRCSHCRHAAPTVKAFIKSHPDVQFRFYNFPLDGTCNKVMQSGDGVSCFLAKAVTCAEKLGQQGWELSDSLFNSQDEIIRMDAAAVREKVAAMAGTAGLEKDGFLACVDGPEVSALVAKQADLGDEVGVKGTPTFFVNGRKLNRAQSLPVLRGTYQAITGK